jgi:hypothetical protein
MRPSPATFERIIPMPLRPDDADDPKGLIFEAFRIPGITEAECRSIFVDWALSLPTGQSIEAVPRLLGRYGPDHPDHPMLRVLEEGREPPGAPRRRGGRGARVPSSV